VFWDPIPPDKINIAGFYRFPPDAMLRGRYRDIILGMLHLPEDLYMFDDSLSWSIVVTHEYDSDGNRWCLWTASEPV
jgi:hypothetical protein